jgi:predicted MFS family arabinose efflux permease
MTVLAFGLGEIIFALVSLFKALPYLWTWATLQSIVVGIGIAQLFFPFLTYFPIWLFLIFFIGGFEGAAVTNTNYKIAEDFRKKGKPEEVRAFAMSYSALGNFSGDAIGGGIAIAVEKLSDRYLHVRIGA